MELLPIKESTTMTITSLEDGTWRDKIVNKIAKAVVATTASTGSNIYFTSATGGAIKVGDTVSGTGVTGSQTVSTVTQESDNTWLVTLSSAINSEVAAGLILNFDQSHASTYSLPTTTSTLHSGIQHDNPNSTNGSEWAYEDIVSAPSRPRPVTLHTKVESTNDDPVSITSADHSIHKEVNSSFITQLDITGNYKDKHIENIVRNLTVLEVFKTSTLISGKTIYEIRFNDSIGVTAANDHRVSFDIIGRVQNPVSRCSQLKKDIFVYSFCLEPEEHQPSGSCNFSRIDTAKLEFSSSGSISNIYAVNYNVLRIMSGMGGLAYSS